MSDKGSKKISGFGNFLRRAREDRQESRERVFESTRVSVSMIRALEEEDFEVLPADVYVRGFIKTLARHLEVDPSVLLSRFSEAKPQEGPTPAIEDVNAETGASPMGENLAQRVSEDTAVKACFAAAKRKSTEREGRHSKDGERRSTPQKAGRRLDSAGGGSRRVNLGLILLLLIVAITLTLSYMLNRSPSSEQQGETPAASETATQYDWKG